MRTTAPPLSKLRHFPLLTPRFEHHAGVRALLPGEPIVERTECFAAEVALKRQLLAEDEANYACVPPGSESSQREAAILLTGQDQPLIEVAREIQEDLVILRGDPILGHPILAGVVCFPSGWSIADKIGKSIDAVHEPVPDYAEVMSRPVNRLLARLKPGRPVWRSNWGIRAGGLLDQSPKRMPELREAARRLDAGNVSQECYFRVERQTLSRLAQSNDILFTIHTHQCPICELETWQQHNLLGVLRSCPSETLRYKGITPFLELLCRDLKLRTSQ
jgi:hypothetical protein